MRSPELTIREEQLLFAFADGLNNVEVAAELFLSVETVKSHSRGLLVKLGAKNRTHAVAIAYHRGILVPLRGFLDQDARRGVMRTAGEDEIDGLMQVDVDARRELLGDRDRIAGLEEHM
jgi:DNA-binding CsgD family transcriptional regulator